MFLYNLSNNKAKVNQQSNGNSQVEFCWRISREQFFRQCSMTLEKQIPKHSFHSYSTVMFFICTYLYFHYCTQKWIQKSNFMGSTLKFYHSRLDLLGSKIDYLYLFSGFSTIGLVPKLQDQKKPQHVLLHFNLNDTLSLLDIFILRNNLTLNFLFYILYA